MNPLILFTLEIAISLGISLIVISLLKPLLTDVLIETCGTEKRAAFWGMFTQLMLFLTPLLIVIYFAPTDVISNSSVVLAIKETLFRTLLGVFTGLAIVGQVIWKSIVPNIPEPANTPIIKE